MSRFNEIEAALLERLRILKARAEVSINLLDVGIPMNAIGFSQEEILEVLVAFEQDRLIAFAPGNRILFLKNLPA